MSLRIKEGKGIVWGIFFNPCQHFFFFLTTEICFSLKVFLENKSETGTELSFLFFQDNVYRVQNSLSRPHWPRTVWTVSASGALRLGGTFQHSQCQCVQPHSWPFGCSDPHPFSLGFMRPSCLLFCSRQEVVWALIQMRPTQFPTVPDNGTRREAAVSTVWDPLSLQCR